MISAFLPLGVRNWRRDELHNGLARSAEEGLEGLRSDAYGSRGPQLRRGQTGRRQRGGDRGGRAARKQCHGRRGNLRRDYGGVAKWVRCIRCLICIVSFALIPELGHCIVGKPLPVPIAKTSVAQLGSSFLLVGGETTLAKPLDTIYYYDPDQEDWRRLPRKLTAIKGRVASVTLAE